MYGFIVAVNGEINVGTSIIQHGANVCASNMISKFQDDKVFIGNEEYIFVLDGVILNKKKLLERVCEEWGEYLIKQYEKNGDTFFSILRGSFSGALYDKKKNRWIIFTDQLGTKFLYYNKYKNLFVCAGEMKSVAGFMRDNQIPVMINNSNAGLLLSYGFMVGNNTILDGVKKIQPGCYIIYDGQCIEEKSYYTLKNKPNELIDEKTAIEEVDKFFREAVRRSFAKDDEYGYKHIVALSGGLDARMVSFVAHSLGYTKRLNITFSQSGYWDQTVPQEMTAYLKHEWLFKSLDNGLWLFDVDAVTQETGGNLLYYGVAHGRSLMKYLNFKGFGIAHSGQLGDVSLSSHFDAAEPYTFGTGAFSPDNIGDSIFDTSDYPDRYKNKEIGAWYTRYLNAINNGVQYLCNYTETISPFLDLDFLEFVLSIPYSLRKEHNIYKKWIINKYPEAAQFVWEKIQAKITSPMVRIGNKGSFAIKVLPNKILSKFHLKKSGVNSLAHMNPYGYYMSNNKELRDYLMGYFNYIDLIDDNILKNKIEKIRNEGKPIEVLQAISVLAAYKFYYLDK